MMNKLNVLDDFKNVLLKRRRLKVLVEAESNPGFENSKKFISDEFGAKEPLIVVREIKSKFGRNTFLIEALVYDSAEDLNRIEPKKKVKKGDAAAGGKK